MKALLIDLDDTLFEELSYVRSGHKAVSGFIAEFNGLEKEDVFEQIKYQLSKYGRLGAFDRAKEYLGISGPDTQSILTVYRSHSPNIELYCGVKDALIRLHSSFKLAVVTDGNPEVQRKKVEALGLEELVDSVVYCMDYDAPKPSPIPYLAAADALGVNIEDSIIIGDDPYYDMVAASKLGILSYRMLRGKHIQVKNVNGSAPVMGFSSFFRLSEFLLMRTG